MLLTAATEYIMLIFVYDFDKNDSLYHFGF